ncbi:RDD family protein [Georgenia sp. Z1491]|uniref:RDD family protein n=1 Tax=Georgenia sp. Z1491 TaxID=3416707 RepID=UPI003CF0002F
MAAPPAPDARRGPARDQAGALTTAGLAGDVVVTSEAVALDLAPTGFATRVLSGLLDGLAHLLGLLASLLLVVGLLDDGINEAQLQALVISFLALWWVGAPMAVEALTRGRSLGRIATGTRVVRDDGGPVRLRHTSVRALAGVGELWLTLGGGAIIASLASGRGQRLGDRLAGTIVVSVRASEALRLPLVMPPELGPWAEGLTVRPLPAALAAAARDLLGRTALMTPQTRAAVSRSLAAQIEPYASRPAPPGAHPERFLAAVLVVRRDAERERLATAQAQEDRAAALMLRLPHEVQDYA